MTLDPIDIERLIDAALSEDLGGNDGIRSAAGDITSRAVIPEDVELEAVLITRENVVVAGLDGHRTEPYFVRCSWWVS